MTKQETQQYVYDFLYGKGLPHIAICAIMGNITGESQWNPDIVEIGAGIGFGLCQWSFSRREQLEAYGITLQHQCDFLWSELSGENRNVTGADYQWQSDPSDRVDNGEGFYCTNNDFMNGNGDIDFLTTAFCYCWERPNYEDSHLTDIRIPSAKIFFDEMEYKGSSDFPIIPIVKKKTKNFKFYLFKGSRRIWRNKNF